MRDRACLVILHSGHIRSPTEKVLNLKEYKFKEGKRRRKTLPPSDSINQALLSATRPCSGQLSLMILCKFPPERK